MTTQKEVFDIINGLYHIKDDKNNVWFYAKELCTYLEYNDTTNKIIKLYISDVNDKIKYSQIKQFAGVKNTPAKIPHNATFINENALYELIDNSKKPNAEKFKKWTRKVLSQIRMGDIKIDNNDYQAPIKISDKGHPIFMHKSQCDNPKSKFYDEEDENVEIFNMLGRTLNYEKLIDKKVLYMYATPINNVDDDRIIVKPGYTKNIKKRTYEHEQAFGCKFKLIALREVNDEDDEQKFHDILKFKYPELYYYFQIQDVKSTTLRGHSECYKWEWKILKEFYNYEIVLKVEQPIVTDNELENNKILLELQHAKNRELELKIEYYKLTNGIQ